MLYKNALVLFADVPSSELPFNNSNFIGDILQIVFLLAVFLIVIFLAYYTTKFIGGSRFNRQSGNISIIESRSIGVGSAIQLIKIGEKYFLIGVTKEHITFLTEVDSNEINNISDKMDSKPVIPFEKIFTKYVKKDK